MRKLSDVVKTDFNQLVKASDLVGVSFTLLAGRLVHGRFGAVIAFDVEVDGETRTLFLTADDFRQQLLEALSEGPIGPVTIEQKGDGNRTYYLLRDAE